MNPCVSAATKHAIKHIDAYRTMPIELYEQIIATRIRSTTFKPISPEALEAYFRPWSGKLGQSLWYNRISYLDEAWIARLQTKIKLSQNRDLEDRQRVIDRLDASDSQDAQATARWMKRVLP